MVDIEDYGSFETAWCPGCGNHSILQSVKEALTGLNIAPNEVCFVSGIGQAAKGPHYLLANVFNGLHGRALPVATGIKLANPNLHVIVQSGDGCNYGEGGNHFLAAIRRNINLTMLVHDNQIYGLTKGQASPTTEPGHVTKAQPLGATSESFNPIAVAVAMRAGFVARGFSGNQALLTSLIEQAISHPGLAMIDILQPCVSFNRVNTFAWYKERCYELGDDYDPSNWERAISISQEWGEQIPTGVIYKDTQREPFESNFLELTKTSLFSQKRDRSVLDEIMNSFF